METIVAVFIFLGGLCALCGIAEYISTHIEARQAKKHIKKN